MAPKKYQYIALVWTGLILFLCLREMSGFPKITIPYKDKVLHFVFYAGFVILWFKATNNQTNKLLIITVIGIILGAIIEFLQLYCTKTRSFDVFDILANSLGALVMYLILKKKFSKENNHAN